MLDWNDDADENHDHDDHDGGDDDNNDDSGNFGGDEDSSGKRPGSQGRSDGGSGGGADKSGNGGNGGFEWTDLFGDSGFTWQQRGSCLSSGGSQSHEQDTRRRIIEERVRCASDEENRDESQLCALPPPPDKQRVPGGFKRKSETAGDDEVSLAGDVVTLKPNSYGPIIFATNNTSTYSSSLLEPVCRIINACSLAAECARHTRPNDRDDTLVLQSLIDRARMIIEGLSLPDELDGTSLQELQNAARLEGPQMGQLRSYLHGLLDIVSF